jgi:hypothetical protein
MMLDQAAKNCRPMTARPLSPAERERIAAQYGCIVKPDVAVTVIPRGASGEIIEPWVDKNARPKAPRGDGMRKARARTSKIVGRQLQMRALKQAELAEQAKATRAAKAAAAPAVAKPRRSVRKARSVAPIAPKAPRPLGPDDLAAYELLSQGATEPQACAALGITRSALKWRKTRLRAAGYTWAVNVGNRIQQQRRARREAEMRALIDAGHRPLDAAVAVGYTRNSAGALLTELRKKGWQV